MPDDLAVPLGDGATGTVIEVPCRTPMTYAVVLGFATDGDSNAEEVLAAARQAFSRMLPEELLDHVRIQKGHDDLSPPPDQMFFDGLRWLTRAEWEGQFAGKALWFERNEAPDAR